MIEFGIYYEEGTLHFRITVKGSHEIVMGNNFAESIIKIPLNSAEDIRQLKEQIDNMATIQHYDVSKEVVIKK